jgi:Concanavalin A-like lectin/glucanases superfamily
MKSKTTKLTLKMGLFIMAIVGLAVAAHATITSDLAGWWQFTDGYGITAPDSSGLGNTGLLSGAAYFITDPDRGQVLNLNGISGEMDVPYSASLTPASGTISVWVKPTQATTADIVRMDTNFLTDCNSGGVYYAYDLRVSSKGAPVAILANDAPKTCGRKPQTVLSGSANQVKLNQWTHLAMTWGGGTLTVYANGKRAGSTSYTPDATGISYHGDYPLKVGASIYDFGNGYLEFIGQVSDFRLYSRALSSSEISSIAAGQ